MVAVKLTTARAEQHASYKPGDVIDVPESDALSMEAAGHCEILPVAPAPSPIKPATKKSRSKKTTEGS